MTYLWIAVGLLIGIPALAALIGSLLPRDHVAQVSLDVSARPESVWAIVSDVTGSGRWRDGVTIEPQPSVNGRVRFGEKTKQGLTPFEVMAQHAPTRQVVRVVDDGLPFGGTWTWELAPTAAGTSVTLTEAGFVRNPIFRLVGRFFFPPTATMDAYLRQLAKHLGEARQPKLLRAR